MKSKPSVLKPYALAIVVFATFVGLQAQDKEQSSKAVATDISPDTVVLTVDETPITVRDVREVFSARYGNQFARMSPEERKLVEPQIQQIVISDLVSRILLINAADKAGYKADEKEVGDYLKNIESTIPEGTSLEDFASQAGLTVDRIKEQVVDEMKIKQVVEKITGEVTKPEEAEVKKYYDEHPDEFAQAAQVEASHILVDTEEKAKDLFAKLEETKGENFADLAKEHSSCPSSAEGGSLGKFGKGQMVPEFETAAFTQKIGDIGKPVKTQFGFHIIQVTAKDEAKQLPYADVKEELAEQMFEERKSAKMNDYVKELRDNAKIVRPGEEEEGEAETAPKESPKSEEDPTESKESE